jgi:hypothetical protein
MAKTTPNNKQETKNGPKKGNNMNEYKMEKTQDETTTNKGNKAIVQAKLPFLMKEIGEISETTTKDSTNKDGRTMSYNETDLSVEMEEESGWKFDSGYEMEDIINKSVEMEDDDETWGSNKTVDMTTEPMKNKDDSKEKGKNTTERRMDVNHNGDSNKTITTISDDPDIPTAMGQERSISQTIMFDKLIDCSTEELHKAEKVAKLMISILNREPLCLNMLEDKVVEALCIITAVPIPFQKVSKCHKEEMLKEAVYILSHPLFPQEKIYNNLEGREILRIIAAMPKNIPYKTTSNEEFVQAIKEGSIQTIDNVKRWEKLATSIGVFLPRNSLKAIVKKKLVLEASDRLTATKFENLYIDGFSFAILAKYTGAYIETAGQIPGILLDRGIPLKERKAHAHTWRVRIKEPNRENEFGSFGWCAAGGKCKVDLYEGEIRCKECNLNTHIDCGTSNVNNEVVCSTCQPIAYRAWRCLGQACPIEKPHIDHLRYTQLVNNTQTDKINSTNAGKKITTNTPHNKLPANLNMVTPTNETSPLTGTKKKRRMITFDSQDSVRTFDPKQKAVQITRFSLRLQIPQFHEDDDSMEVLRTTIRDMLVKLKQADPDIECYNWSSQNVQQESLNIDEMPSTLEGIQVFFDRIRSEPGLKAYCDVRLQHGRQWEDIKKDIGTWLRNKGHALFRRRLQQERIKPIGWFLFSTRDYNAESLITAINAQCKVDVDIRWGIVRLERNEELGDAPVKALIVWSSEDTELLTRNTLYQHYNIGRKYPLAIMMRFISLGINFSNRTLNYAKIAREEQGVFDLSTKRVTVDFVNLLDFRPSNRAIPTLRNIIMSRKTRITDHDLFYAVDKSWRPNHVTFVFSKRVEKEAIDFIHTLVGWCIHQYGMDVAPFFTHEAMEAGRTMKYEKSTDSILTTDDIMMKKIMTLISRRRIREAEKDAESESQVLFKMDEESFSEEEEEEKPNTVFKEGDTNETELEKRVTDMRLGIIEDDVGTMRSGITNQSQKFGQPLDVDRSTVRSDQEEDSTIGSTGRDKIKQLERSQQVTIANMQLLQEREKATQEMNQRLLLELQEMRAFQDKFLQSKQNQLPFTKISNREGKQSNSESEASEADEVNSEGTTGGLTESPKHNNKQSQNHHSAGDTQQTCSGETK